MKMRVLSIAVTASLLVALAVITANAGIFAKTVATIPFDFATAKHIASAGTYTISETEFPGVLLLTDAQGDHGVFLFVQRHADSKDVAKRELVFHRYGKQYFLAQIMFGEQRGYQLLMSPAELEIVKSNSLAKNEQKPELVYVAAH